MPGGLIRASYRTDRFDLRAAAAEHLAAGGFVSQPLPLETLHERIEAQHRRTDTRSLNSVSARLSAAPAALLEGYHGLVKFVACEILGQDVLFEANPFLRFYFPGVTLDGYRAPDGRAVSYHSDTMFGDAFQQVNCWVPLGRTQRTNALQCGALERSIELLTRFARSIDFDADRYANSRNLFFARLCDDAGFLADVRSMCSPVAMRYGEILLFDARVIHGTLDNEENETRVSIDFRLLPVSVYWMQRLEPATAPRAVARRLRGHYWDARSAFEL